MSDGVPGLLDIVDHDARTGLVLERVDGSDTLTLLDRKPWRVLDRARRTAPTHGSVDLAGGTPAGENLVQHRAEHGEIAVGSP